MRVEADVFFWVGPTPTLLPVSGSLLEALLVCSIILFVVRRSSTSVILNGYVGGLIYLSYLEPKNCNRYSLSLYPPPGFIPVHGCLISFNKLRAVAMQVRTIPYCFQND